MPAISPAPRALTVAGHPALLVRPRGAHAGLVLAHGAGAGMRHEFLAGVAAALAGAGVATLRWDMPFMAAGARRPDRPEVAQAAVRAVWHAARARLRGLPLFAGGKSFGGRMTTGAHAAAPLPGVRGVVLLGFPLHPPDRPDAAAARAAHLAAAAGPLLFVQGDRDGHAPLPALRPIVRALGARATLHVVRGADHGFAVRRADGRTPAEVLAEIAAAIGAWTRALVG